MLARLTWKTHRTAPLLAACLAISALATAFAQETGARRTATIPADTALGIRLTETVSTLRSKRGQPVRAILTAPVVAGDEVLLPLGCQIEGRITELHSVKLGFAHETASIGIEVERILTPSGQTLPLQARVAQIENAREHLDKKGRIAGVRSTSTLSHKASGAVGFVAMSNPVALIFTTASSASLLRFSDPEITLPAGAELILKTSEAIEISEPSPAGAPELASAPAEREQLQALVRRQPFRTATYPKGAPSDLTNLMFVGDEASILRAFHAAGWLPVDALDATSTYKTIRAVSESQGYKTAPMSTLTLGGAKPAYALAKTLDTFSKRHHLRLYATKEQWKGQPVWVSSSTQDIGIGFSAGQKNFIHQIDHNIDHERTKVVNDLLLTGCVQSMNLAARSWLPEHPKNGTGEEIETDGAMAVLAIGDCSAPQHAQNAAPVPDAPQPRQDAHPVAKGVRQTTLTLRNMILRDNIFVTAYGGVKGALGLKHPQPPEQPLALNSSLYASHYALPASAAAGPGDLAQPVEKATPPPVRGPRPLPPYTIEIGIHSGLARYAGGNGGAVGYSYTPDFASDPFSLLVLENEHTNGWTIGGSVTLNTHEHWSHEISFDYNRTGFLLSLGDLEINNTDDVTDPSMTGDFLFDEVSLSTSEVAYNLQYLPLRRSSRWRPYVGVGPSLRLMHLTDAPVAKASPWFRLGLSSVGALLAAYDFGSTPALDGGGIFQFGLQYGAGIKYRATRRILLRADYKETLSAQPDFWSKSVSDVTGDDDPPGYKLEVIGPVMDGMMRQQRITMGASLVF